MSRLNELIRKMIDEAPVEFRDSQLVYVKELAKIYANEVAQASLEKASKDCKVIHKDYGVVGQWEVDKESIIKESNIILL